MLFQNMYLQKLSALEVGTSKPEEKPVPFIQLLDSEGYVTHVTGYPEGRRGETSLCQPLVTLPNFLLREKTCMLPLI